MKIIFATGGTAGHINPALAVASYIKENFENVQIMFIGTADHMESTLVPNAGFDFETIKISGFRRSFSPSAVVHNVKTVCNMFSSSSASKKIIKNFAPDVVVGFGGYVSGPVLNVAAKMGIPTCIHEQNSFPGITNKSLAKVVDKVMLTSEDAKSRMNCKNEPVVTGLPVRGEILRADREKARKKLNIPDGKVLVLSTGGSLGAKPLNDAMIDILVKHSEDKSCYHIHSAGKSNSQMFDDLEKAGLKKCENIVVRQYIDNMDECLAAADIVVGRAGASTISELLAMGKPSILIPSPYVAENHQYHNAMSLVKRGAATIIEEKDLTSEKLMQTIDTLAADKYALQKMSENAKKMAIVNARSSIANIIVDLAKK